MYSENIPVNAFMVEAVIIKELMPSINHEKLFTITLAWLGSLSYFPFFQVVDNILIIFNKGSVEKWPSDT